MTVQPGSRISKYEIEKFLGGGMSHVFRARDTVIGRTVAVKILTDEGCIDKDVKARFLFEAQTSGNIVHENIIQIYDYGEEQGRPFMVMEFLVGQDLRDAIKNGQTGDLLNRLRISLQIARALEYVHSKGIVHRDIKPENVHLDGSGKAKLMDFGIAKAQGLSLTRAGFALGTPYYMAPEQVMGEKVTEQADVYAFGILMFELFSGQRPIAGDTIERLFYSILNETINMEPLKQAGVPEHLRNVIAKCTAKKAPDRFPNMSSVATELATIIKEETPAAAPPVEPRKSGKTVAIAVVALLLVVTAGLIWYAWPKPHKVLDPTLKLESGDMVLIPRGPFLYGKDKASVIVPDFYADRTEVTNAAYKLFCSKTGHALPQDFRSDRDNEPVANVTFYDAQEFARWANKRLPNSEEWEKSARGTNGFLYPWGDDADASKANVADNPNIAAHEVLAVGSIKGNASPYGMLDMSGNVFEWVDAPTRPNADKIAAFKDLMTPPPTLKDAWFSMRGGSYRVSIKDAVADDFVGVPANYRALDLGFRCVRSVPR
jgi:formylglycine-generating enzyme required for sulfatase activity